MVGEEAEDGSLCGDELVEKIRSGRFGASASQICVVHLVRMSQALESLSCWLLVYSHSLRKSQKRWGSIR
jgi:hypothetical protein